MKKNKKKKNWILNGILVLAILCFLGSGGYLLKYYLDGWQKEKSLSDLHDLIIDEGEPAADSESGGESALMKVQGKRRRPQTAMQSFLK